MPGQEDFTAKQAEYRSHAEKMRQMAAEAIDEVPRRMRVWSAGQTVLEL